MRTGKRPPAAPAPGRSSRTTANNTSIQAASYALDFNRSGAANNVFPASQNDWLALAYDGGGQIGLAAQGITQDLGREERFLVAPEKMEPCLTVDERTGR